MKQPPRTQKDRTRPDTYFIKLLMPAKTAARIKRLMAELNWDAAQVIESAVDLLYLATTRKDPLHKPNPNPRKRTP